MSTAVLAIVAIISAVVWIMVSRESVKSTKEISWKKMFTLLSAGCVTTLLLIISLIQSLI